MKRVLQIKRPVASRHRAAIISLCSWNALAQDARVLAHEDHYEGGVVEGQMMIRKGMTMAAQLSRNDRSTESSQSSWERGLKKGEQALERCKGDSGQCSTEAPSERVNRYKFTEKKADTVDREGGPSNLPPGSTAGSHPPNPWRACHGAVHAIP